MVHVVTVASGGTIAARTPLVPTSTTRIDIWAPGFGPSGGTAEGEDGAEHAGARSEQRGEEDPDRVDVPVAADGDEHADDLHDRERGEGRRGRRAAAGSRRDAGDGVAAEGEAQQDQEERANTRTPDSLSEARMLSAAAGTSQQRA